MDKNEIIFKSELIEAFQVKWAKESATLRDESLTMTYAEIIDFIKNFKVIQTKDRYETILWAAVDGIYNKGREKCLNCDGCRYSRKREDDYQIGLPYPCFYCMRKANDYYDTKDDLNTEESCQ